MGYKLPCMLLLTALLAGCAAGAAPSQSAPPPEQSASLAEPAADQPAEEIYVDDPDSPYPMVVESWSVDMDGDGTEELVELRAEKGYFGNETEPDKWFEGDGMHPYTLVVTQGETIHELSIGWEDNGSPPLVPMYWDQERTGRCWTRDPAGNPVLVLWFDALSRELDVYAAAFLDGEPVLQSIPEDKIEAALDQRFEWND